MGMFIHTLFFSNNFSGSFCTTVSQYGKSLMVVSRITGVLDSEAKMSLKDSDDAAVSGKDRLRRDK